MKFGTVSLADAEGCVLAHSVALTKGRLRKGQVLTSADLRALRASGHDNVIAATLGPDDMGENAAADALADAIMTRAQGVERGAAFTGRVNLVAAQAGVAVLDTAAIAAINEVDPMITIATVPPFQQMRAGGMLATIKIISYAVPKDAVARAAAAARGAVTLAGPVLTRAALIITEIPGGAGEKGRAAIEGRLDTLGVSLGVVKVVAHERAALTAAIRDENSPLVLILTGSATSDIDDVAPAALVAAGGRIERFGMPVDPGNLLFLGTRGPQQVIGLPGCARSPALNGADWVLSRIVCGLKVTGADIAAMGVGGLLKEIPTRPQPRRGTSRA
ncbi:molybdopterin-binding protein [uncultured Sulfitobacter sp.]|uniref:molybdopterin-binding protein n=1 Tax=uncultured Sulfitobacter sp. TaxID=191468 RepID=UPI002625D26E|nr:molybdopterin-binding protein [uncultured Sulfitobacter sp.]